MGSGSVLEMLVCYEDQRSAMATKCEDRRFNRCKIGLGRRYDELQQERKRCHDVRDPVVKLKKRRERLQAE
jgi:hypothetical protein